MRCKSLLVVLSLMTSSFAMALPSNEVEKIWYDAQGNEVYGTILTCYGRLVKWGDRSKAVGKPTVYSTPCHDRLSLEEVELQSREGASADE